jgi:hypothetical protein
MGVNSTLLLLLEAVIIATGGIMSEMVQVQGDRKPCCWGFCAWVGFCATNGEDEGTAPRLLISSLLRFFAGNRRYVRQVDGSMGYRRARCSGECVLRSAPRRGADEGRGDVHLLPR